MSFGGLTVSGITLGTNVSVFGVYGNGASLSVSSKCTFDGINGVIAMVDGGVFRTTAHSPQTIINNIGQHGFIV
jgi:predicted outer membrane repeat protein